jgi:NTP pyrophosphatase (non-canonical NTP hydrolase)
MIETQATISKWARDMFGENQPSNMSTAVRANKEMSELLRDLAINDHNPHAIEEAADVVILLFVLASRMDRDLLAAVNRKMSINRDREWTVDATGHGYHVEKAASHG